MTPQPSEQPARIAERRARLWEWATRHAMLRDNGSIPHDILQELHEAEAAAAAPDPVASRLLRELVMFLSTPTPVRGELARTLAEARRFLATEGEADWTPTDLGESGR